MFPVNRRQMLTGLICFPFAFHLPKPLYADPRNIGSAYIDRPVHFRVLGNGSEIGYHRIEMTRRENRLIADIDIFLEVGLGPLILFRYHHKNREEWIDGIFRRFQSETDDDGTLYKVYAERQGDQIRIRRDHDDDIVSQDISLLPTTYWNPETVTRSRLIDTQKGRILETYVKKGPLQEIDFAAGPSLAQKYDMSGDLTLSLWYDERGRWSKLTFPLNGALFEYEPV